MATKIEPAPTVVRHFLALSNEDQKLVLMEVVPQLVRKMDRREIVRFLSELFAESAEALV